MELLSGDLCGPFEVEDPVDDVADFEETAERVKVCHTRAGCGGRPSS
jgi:hypothetical protein